MSTQSNDSQLEKLKQKLSGIKRLAWKPIVQKSDGDVSASKFAGKPWLNPHEKWPICPNCSHPMQFFFQVNLDELSDKLQGKFGSGILQFFYCTYIQVIEYDTGLYGKTISECETLMKNLPPETYENISPSSCHVDWDSGVGKIKLVEYKSCERFDPFSPCQLVRIVQPSTTSAIFEVPKQPDFFEPKLIIDWLEVEDYPNSSEIEDFEINLDEDEEMILDEVLTYELFQDGTKLGGWADWVQSPEYPDCPICGNPMNQFVFQVDDDDNLPHPWGDAGVGYIVQCPQHKDELAFFWQCC